LYRLKPAAFTAKGAKKYKGLFTTEAQSRRRGRWCRNCLEEQLIGKTKTLTAKAQRTRRARRKDFFYFAGKVPAKQNPLRRFAAERVFWHGFHGCHGKDEDAHHRGVEGFFCHRRTQVE